ncbi:MAG: hypothetical protein Q4B91_00215 [Atopobiaceae bacterium]|nr:hypothetical protein [Atopobiaceae bacterium]
MSSTVDIPVIAMITRFDNKAAEKIGRGARIINVAAGRRTPEVEASEQIGDEDFVSPYRGRLPRLPFFGRRAK